jgi:hypothetical protein
MLIREKTIFDHYLPFGGIETCWYVNECSGRFDNELGLYELKQIFRINFNETQIIFPIDNLIIFREKSCH